MVTRTAASRQRNAQCALCGTDISHRGWQAKFCERCRDHRRNNYKLALEDLPPVTMYDRCIGCSTPYDAPRWQQFCSRECQGRNAAAKRFRIDIHKTCAGCGTAFTTTNPKRVTCSPACAQWKNTHPGVLRVLDKECAFCATPFEANTPRRKYCTPACQLSVNHQRRNKRTLHCFVEDVSRHVVAVRDKWRCQLCRKKVNPDLTYPHPMSWSLDHIIPISRDGEHSYANTQLAHLSCNVRKKNKITEPLQLALIG